MNTPTSNCPDDLYAFVNLDHITALSPVEILALEKLAEQRHTTIAEEIRRILRQELITQGLLPESKR